MKRSEILLIDLDPVKDAEIQKKRPAVIVNDDALGITAENYYTCYRLEGPL
jgi:mRNA-degrading endonuclease toxin of MazEF toxin-antitoxin module